MLMFSYARLGTPWQSGADFRVYLGPTTMSSGHEDNIISSKRENPSEGSQAPPRSSPPTSDAQQAPGAQWLPDNPLAACASWRAIPRHSMSAAAPPQATALLDPKPSAAASAPRRGAGCVARAPRRKKPHAGAEPHRSAAPVRHSRAPPPALSGSHGVLPPAESAARAIGLQTRAREEADARAAREIKRRAARRFTSALSLISRRALPAS